jgi:HK97 gp10 family phage protein
MPAIGVKLKIQGLDAVKKAFKELEPKLAKKVIAQAERKALAPIKAAVVASAPRKTGDLRRSIRIRVAKGPRKSGKKTIAMGLLVGAGSKGKKGKKTGQTPWWAFLMEWGWIRGKRIRSGGKVVGRTGAGAGQKVQGKHFVRKSMRAHETQAQQIMRNEILAGIEREAGKP